MFGAGWGAGEITLVFAVVLVLFGPKRLPEAARMIGRMIAQLRRASQEFKDQVMNLDAPIPPQEKGVVDPEASSGKQAEADDDNGGSDA